MFGNIFLSIALASLVALALVDSYILPIDYARREAWSEWLGLTVFASVVGMIISWVWHV